MMEIYCKNIDEKVECQGGETLAQIYQRIEGRIGFKPICARVNNKTEGMNYPVYAPKQVEYLPVESPSGNRVYVRSLCMLLYKAVHDCFPGTRLRIEHSVSKGYYCRLFSGAEATEANIALLRSRMAELVTLDLPLVCREGLTADVLEYFRRQGLNDKVRLLSTVTDIYTTYYELDGLCDCYYGNLAPSTGWLGVFDLVPYAKGFLLMGRSAADATKAETPVKQEKMFEAFTNYLKFNRVIGVRNVGELNLAVDDGRGATLINVAEALHVKYIDMIATEISHRNRQGDARIVLIAGPSSSGKTTFAKRLSIQLMTNLIEPCIISLDDYFVNRDQTPLDEHGEYDYESLYALDLETFNRDLNALIAGQEVELPYYNFELGCRQYRGNKIRLKPDNVLVIEGIHGLNPELTAHVEERLKYRVYVSALTTLAIDDHNWMPTTDNRLLRRIIRDNRYRGVNVVETIRRWPSVRRGEEKWIFPFQENADAMFNSSLLFELAVMKEEAEKILKGVPRNVPEYGEAWRLRTILNYFRPVDEKVIPPTSLLREFLGGSSFHY